MDKLQWVVSGDGSCIWRWDDHQRRRCFRIGFDGSLVLKEWLMLYHRRQNLARCGRVVKSLHRAGEGLAQGLVLPGPQSGSFIRALGHREIWKQAESIDLKRAAMATGGICVAPWCSQEHPGPTDKAGASAGYSCRVALTSPLPVRLLGTYGKHLRHPPRELMTV